jgi:hypothetical protein
MLTTEPEWWLRMMCGQLAHEDTAVRYAGMKRVLRRAQKQFWSVVLGGSRRMS